jgi:PAS domain S-box-containing protein
MREFKILVVDDDQQFLDITKRTLQKAYYNVFSAINGAECMTLLQKENPDIILLNIMLPDVNGLDLCKKIKSSKSYASVYIILLSSLKTGSGNVSEGLDEGADGYIIRPVDSRELLARVNAASRIVSAENKIRSDKILLEACIDSPKDMIVLAIDKQFNYLAFNTYHKNIMLQAYGKEIKPGMNILACITNEDDMVKSKINYGRAMNGESHITIEEYGELDRQYYETRYNPFYNERNEIVGATAFSFNVTERKRMEISLKRSEEKFRKAFITSPDAININRLSDGMYISINDGFTNIMGYAEKDVIGKTSLELNIWVDPADRVKLARELNAKGMVVNLEASFRNKDNSVRIGSMSASIIDLDGVLHILSITRDITAHKKDIDSLEKRNAFIQAIIDNLPIGLAVNDFDSGLAEYLNPKFSEIYGWPIEEITDITRFFELVYPDAEYRKEISSRIMNDINSGDINRMHWDEIKIQTKDKGERIISASNIPILEQNIMVSTVRDITELKKAEASLRENEVLFKEIFESVSVGVVYATLTGDILAINKTLEVITGIKREDVVGKSLLIVAKKLLTADNVKYVTPIITNLLKNKHIKPFQLKYKNKILEISSSGDSKSERLTGIVRDITELKRAENALKERSGDLQKELEKQRKTDKELQKSYKKLEISKIATFNLLEDLKMEMEQRRKVEDEINKLNLELEQRVNERTSQLEAANSELQAFAYSVSHDLRAPLRAIDGFSKFIMEDYETKLDNEGKRLLGLIRSNTQKMDQLIVDILALSRVSRSEHTLSKVEMKKMVVSMLNEVATPEMQEKISIIIDHLPDTYADPIYIKQVWTNLLSNAIKFSSLKKKPEIKIGGYKEKEFYVYYIQDNGVGFNPEYKHKLFGVFQRLHKANEFEGTGVGLAIVQRIILRHGGKVWAESVEGKGATFYFSLPVKNRD